MIIICRRFLGPKIRMESHAIFFENMVDEMNNKILEIDQDKESFGNSPDCEDYAELIEIYKISIMDYVWRIQKEVQRMRGNNLVNNNSNPNNQANQNVNNSNNNPSGGKRNKKKTRKSRNRK
jgi:hypothetical protein